MKPALRPVFEPDAMIGYKHVGDHDMPFVVALVVPFVVLVVTVLTVECLWVKQCWQRRTITLINILLTFLAAVAVVGFMTELFKRLAGRLRWVLQRTVSVSMHRRQQYCAAVACDMYSAVLLSGVQCRVSLRTPCFASLRTLQSSHSCHVCSISC
jgi:hypothetical protein